MKFGRSDLRYVNESLTDLGFFPGSSLLGDLTDFDIFVK